MTKKAKAPVKAKVKPKAKAARPAGQAPAKPAAKLVAKAPAKSAPAAGKPAPTKSAEKTGFMWKMLERKEAELKRRNGEREQYDSEYARFNQRRRGA